MTPERFEKIVERYATLRIVVVGDYSLDRYLDIDPSRAETSIETGLPVHNVVGVRSNPGAAGTILNNLVALGVGTLHPVGFRGVDGEGSELQQALEALEGVDTSHFLKTPRRRTFVYCKPLIHESGKPPRELNRLDSKNFSVTPEDVSSTISESLLALAPSADAIVALEQVDLPETGVLTSSVQTTLGAITREHPEIPIIADSRQGLGKYPPLIFKMNRAELARLRGRQEEPGLPAVKANALALARENRRPVFISLAEDGILSASPNGNAWHQAALPLRGEIDIVGAGDSVTANLVTALAAGATIPEALKLAAFASSIVIHQLGATGTASVSGLRELLAKTQP